MDQTQHMIDDLGRKAKSSSAALRLTSCDTINRTLNQIASALKEQADRIIEVNMKDLEAAKEKKLSEALLDRLTLNIDRIDNIAKACEDIAKLPDPVGHVLWENERPNGLKIQRVSVPIGVLGMIYESRPNVTVDAAALCLKSRNAVILRGGSESLYSSLAFHEIIQETLDQNNISKDVVSMISTPDREAVGALLRAHRYVDVMIPRGGKGLIERVQSEARMPVFSHLDGICHVYIHESAREDIAIEVPLNAKMRRTGICGAMETLLIDQNLNPDIARKSLETLLDAGCDIVGDKMAQRLDPRICEASTNDWETEYLTNKLSCAVVNGVDEAIQHINTFGSHHTDSILCEDGNIATKFMNEVDSAITMHNTSTQFADGGEFGLGAEIGIATGKMHARGPVGLEQLCTYKYKVLGSGQTRPT